MTNWLKRIRGAVGMGLTWAVPWSVIGALVSVLPGTISPAPYPLPLEWLVGLAASFAAQFAAFGFVGGATFSVILGVIEGRRSFDQMSLPRFAAWGACGGVMMWAARDVLGLSLVGLLGSVGVPGLNWLHALSGGTVVLLAAGSAAGSLALARRAGEQELLEAGGGMAESVMTPLAVADGRSGEISS